jgi:cyclic dehypoxanthinyl futalosine synthase
MKTSVTMMYGLGETLAERVEHLHARARGAGAHGRLHGLHHLAAAAREHAGLLAHAEDRRVEYLRTVAISRLVLDNVPNLQASWVTMGMKVGQTALRFGCNDFGSLMIEENVVSAANTTHRTTIDEMERLIRDAGFTPARRTQDYRVLLPNGEAVPASSLPDASPALAA